MPKKVKEFKLYSPAELASEALQAHFLNLEEDHKKYLAEKENLKASVEAAGVPIEGPLYRFSVGEPTTAYQLNAELLKAEMPEIYNRYLMPVEKVGAFRIIKR